MATRDTNKAGPFADFAAKVLPSLFVATAMSMGSAAWAIYKAVQNVTNRVEQHELELIMLRNEISAIKAAQATRSDLQETVRRIEAQMELMILRSGGRVEAKR